MRTVSVVGDRRKYGRPSRAVTVTLPEDTLARLASVHADIGSAIVNLVERKTPCARRADSCGGSHARTAITPSSW